LSVLQINLDNFRKGPSEPARQALLTPETPSW
jgi:hypothetical protein